jgi:SAGA-associated factor 29
MSLFFLPHYPSNRIHTTSAVLHHTNRVTDLSKTRLSPSTEVLYRDPKKRTNTEGEGILCRVTSVIGEGKQRRYEIIDADPDPPTPSVPYRASVNHLVPIPPPSSNTTLPDLNKGKNVLALYPGTTTFYKAEVVAGWKVSDGKVKSEEGVENLVRLRFEGEDEADREMSVERRYVLPDK